MGIWDGIKGQLRSVITWENPGQSELFTLWSDNGDEIKNASKLIVGPGQGTIFVYEGRVQGVYIREGSFDLRTANIPFWTTVSKFTQAFESQHKVAIYFFKTAKIVNQKWGTKNTIKYEDPKYKFPVGLMAYGNLSFQIIEPKNFFSSIVAGAPYFTTEQFREIMIDRIIQPLSDYFAEAKYSYVDIDSKRNEIASDLIVKFKPIFLNLGFRITDFRIEGTSFDDATVTRINRIADITAEATAAKNAGMNYADFQKLEAVRDAAQNEGGGAGAGLGIGAGVGLGQMMAGALSPQTGANEAIENKEDIEGKLAKLKKLFEADLITESEYMFKKSEILEKF